MGRAPAAESKPIRRHALAGRATVRRRRDESGQKIGVDGGASDWLIFNFSPLSTHPFPMSIEIKIRKNEPIDRALRRMKKKLERENIIKDVRAKRYFEKPCEKRRRKNKVAAFTAMLRARYAN